MAEVTVAVVSWNTRELLDSCLRSLEATARTGLAEVWVIDNGSRDGSATLVRERHPWVQLLVQDRNVGFGAAVNRVAAQTNTPWIVAANADVECTDGALRALLDAGRAHPRAGALAPQLMQPDGNPQHSVYSFPTLAFALLFNLGLGHVSPRLGDRLALEGRWNPDQPRPVDWAVGAFLMIRRTAWDAVGGFDERQWMYAEDLDLGWRLARAGWSTWYEPSVRVNHAVAAATGQAWGEDRTEQWMWSTYGWLLRRRGPFATRTYAAINVLGAQLRASALAARARRDPARFAWRRDRMREWVRLHRIGLSPRAELERHR